MAEFPEGFSPMKALDVCKALFMQMHDQGIGEKEAYAITLLMVPIACRSMRVDKDATIKAVEGAFEIIDALLKGKPPLNS